MVSEAPAEGPSPSLARLWPPPPQGGQADETTRHATARASCPATTPANDRNMQPGSNRQLHEMPAKRPPPTAAAVRECIRPSPCSGVNRIPWPNDSDSTDIAQTDAAPSPGHRGQARHDDQLCRLRRRQAPGRHCHRRTAPRAGQQRGIRLDCAEGPGTNRDPDAAGDPGPARAGGGGHAARRPALQGRGIRPDAVRHDEGGRAV